MSRFWVVTATAFVLAVAADLVLGEPPGRYAAFGFVGCVVLVAATKALGAAGLQRPDPDATVPPDAALPADAPSPPEASGERRTGVT